MPRRKMRPQQKRAGHRLEIPGKRTSLQVMNLVDYLMFGKGCFAMFCHDFVGFEYETDEQRTWELNKDLLLSMMTADPFRPADFHYLAGNRPWAWWKYESGVGKEIWSDSDRFSHVDWQRWQYDFLKECGLISQDEEEKVRRLCKRILSEPKYNVNDPLLKSRFTDGGKEERKRRRESRKRFELDDK